MELPLYDSIVGQRTWRRTWPPHLRLARSHARSGEAAMISGYLGESDSFDTAIAAFSAAYADQTERDHAALKKAARQKRIEVMIEREE